MVSWPPWRADRVTCIACGTAVVRADAREYDKYGDRWERDEKEFEHLCKPCHRELSHRSRLGVEALVSEIDDGLTHEEFCARYLATAADDPREVERRGGRE